MLDIGKLKLAKVSLAAGLCLALSSLSAAEYFVNQKIGSDKNDGSKGAPFKTIQAAANIAKAGDTITVAEGVYREMIDPKNGGKSDLARIVYQGEKGKKVQLKGSEVIKGWQKLENGTWKVVIPNKFFGAHNPYKTEIEGDWFGMMGRPHHTGEVFLNGKSLYEKNKLEKLTALDQEVNPRDPEGSKLRWFVESDDENTTIYANFGGADPNKELVEISTRFSCFYPTKEGVNYITIRNFDISQAATQWGAPTAHQIGMVSTNWSKGWIIENNKIHDSKCSGITLGKDLLSGHNLWLKKPEKDGSVHYIEATFAAVERGWSKDKIGSHIVRNNEIYNCEQTGMCGSQGAAFSIIEDNYIHDIWTKRQFDGAEIGGIKFHAAIDTIIRRNRIENCGRGIWLDWMTQGTRVTQNLLYGNTTDDVHVEVNHGPFTLDNNIFLSRIGVYVFSGGGLYANNLFDGMFRHFFDGRYTPYHFAHSTRIKGVSVCVDDNRYFNNLFTATLKHNEVPNLELYGLSYYKGKKGRFTFDFNAYLNRANQPDGEKNSLANKEFNADLKLEEKGGEVWLSFNLPQGFEKFLAPTVEGGKLGETFISEEYFENPDGSELVLDTDYFGNKRGKNSLVGPFSKGLKAGLNKIKVWPRK